MEGNFAMKTIHGYTAPALLLTHNQSMDSSDPENPQPAIPGTGKSGIIVLQER